MNESASHRRWDIFEIAIVVLLILYFVLRMAETWDSGLYGVLCLLTCLLVGKVIEFDAKRRWLHALLWTVVILTSGWLLSQLSWQESYLPTPIYIPLAIYAIVWTLVWVAGLLYILRLRHSGLRSLLARGIRDLVEVFLVGVVAIYLIARLAQQGDGWLVAVCCLLAVVVASKIFGLTAKFA